MTYSRKFIFLSVLFLSFHSLFALDWSQKITSGVSGGTQNRIYFKNESTGWILGLGSTFFKTTTSGSTWSKVTVAGASDFYSMVFMNNEVGFLSADVGELYKTTDGGNTWALVDDANFPKVIMTDMHCATLENGNKRLFAIGGYGRPNSNTFENRNTILYSDDSGETWTTLKNVIGVSNYSKSQLIDGKIVINNLFGVSFLNYNTLSMSSSSIGNFTSIRDIYFLNNSNGWAVGEENKIFRTEDGGTTWEEVNDLPGDGYLESVYFVNPYEGFVGDDMGNVHALKWAGEKVISSENLSSWPIEAFHFHNQSEGVLLTGSPTVYTSFSGFSLDPNATEIDKSVVSYGVFVGTTDLELSEVLNAPNGKCNASFAPELKIKNVGEEDINAFNVKVFSGSDELSSQDFTQTLAVNESKTITLDSVTLNGAGIIKIVTSTASDTNFLNDTVSINPNAITTFPYVTGFDPGSLWTVNNPDNDESWEIGNFKGKKGSSDMYKIDNYRRDHSGKVDQLISPELDLTQLTHARLIFEYAYAPDANNLTEGIKISISDDCGITLTEIITKTGNDLATKSAQSHWFIPTTSQWKTDTIDITSFIGNTSQQLYIDNIGNYGNVIYLDNIKIEEFTPDVTGLNSPKIDESTLIYPNPFEDYIMLPQSVTSIDILNANGVFVKHVNTSVSPSIDLSDLAKGYYIGIYSTATSTGQIKLIKK